MFFIAFASVLSSLGQLKSFYRLMMGKVEIGTYLLLTVDILTSFTEMFLE